MTLKNWVYQVFRNVNLINENRNLRKKINEYNNWLFESKKIN